VTDPDDDDEDNMGTLLIALMQKERRKKRKEGLDMLTIGYSVYKVNLHKNTATECVGKQYLFYADYFVIQ